MKTRHKILSASLSAAIILNSVPALVVYAEDTGINTFLTDLLTMSVSKVNDLTVNTAISTVMGDITNLGEAVFYKSEKVGYYNGGILYEDGEYTKPLVKKTGDTFEVDPSFLSKLLSDVNKNMVENQSKTDIDNWTDVIGNYDVTLGDISITKEQWIPLSIKDGTPDLTNAEDFAASKNFSLLSGIYTEDLQYNGAYRLGNPWFVAYIIDTSGNLYLQNSLTGLSNGSHSIRVSPFSISSAGSPYTLSSSFGSINTSSNPILRMTMGKDEDGNITKFIYAATSDEKKFSNAIKHDTSSVFYSVGSNDQFTGTVADIRSSGILWFKDYFYNANKTSDGQIYEAFSNMFQTQSASRTVVGNTVINNNLARISNLTAQEKLTITSTGWYVNGTSIGEYLGTANVNGSGEYADISTVADIEPMNFNVVVPLSLPVYVDSAGKVFVADNAKVHNRSCAAVAVKDVQISATPGSGWSLVETPSKTRDAKEFSFTSSLQQGIVLDVDENLSFTYDVKLSPCTEGSMALDLANVRVTLCWADELT